MHRRAALLLTTVAYALTIGSACSVKADRFTIDRVAERSLRVPDLGEACTLGSAFDHVLAAVSPDNPPHRAMIFAELSAGMCAEIVAWDAELDSLRAKTNFGELGSARSSEVRDARLRKDRAHVDATNRLMRAFGHTEAEWGPVGEECPKVKEKDELVYLLGVLSGVNGLLHDRRSGGEVGVPLDLILRAGRGATCMDDDKWWHLPTAVQAAGWTQIPGSAPEGVDPWAVVEEAANKGDASGVRVARALQIEVLANSGMDDELRAAIAKYAESTEQTPRSEQYALLDVYAHMLIRHHSDVIWTKERGHRTDTLGKFPTDPVETPATPNPFGDDPFADPFADPNETPPTPEDAAEPTDEGESPVEESP